MLTKILELLQLKESVDQSKSEAIIAITTLLYQADGKVKLEEQEMFEQLLAELPWNNKSLSKEAFHRDMISKSLVALNSGNLSEYLSSRVPALKSDARVLTVLRELAITDGDLDTREAEILKQVSALMV